MALKYVLEDLSSDLAFIAQTTSGVVKQVLGIKKKAENAQGAGVTDAAAKLDGAFFLSRELFDLDSTPYLTYANGYLDSTVTKLKDLFSFQFGVATPTVLGPYYRNWPGTVAADYTVRAVAVTSTSLSGLGSPFTLGGYTVADGERVLLTAQTSISQNGVYTYTLSSGTLTRVTSTDVQNATLHVASGTSHTYTNTAWWNYGTVTAPQYAQMIEFTTPATLSGDALYNARSHRIYGETYYQTVKDIETHVGTLKTAITNFISAVTALKAATTIADVISNATTVVTHKQTIDTTIGTITGEVFVGERIASYFNTWIPWNTSIWTAEDRQNQIMGGYMYKPHKFVSPPTEFLMLEKTYNNNFTKALGDGSGGTSPSSGSMTGSSSQSSARQADAMVHANAILEYWSQIGWMTAERANNYRTYIEHLERDMVEKGLEEILEMHDKAVKDTYESEKDLPTGFLSPFSPKPIPKNKRAVPDSSLPYTDEELRALGIIP